MARRSSRYRSMSQTDFPKLAYSIGELAASGPVGRSTIYNAIAAGRLRAKKIGRRTIVLDEDWRAFLTDAPIVARPNPPAPLDDAASPMRRPSRTSRRLPAAPLMAPAAVPSVTAGKGTPRSDNSRKSGAGP
jgi:predicted DNA-binding transcriptional regulator AlpA